MGGRFVDGAALSAFRFVFGLAGLAGALRYLGYGWVDLLYVEPKVFLAWPIVGELPHLPGRWMLLHFALTGLAALALALGWRTRFAAFAFFVLFTWIELLDQTNYLNHYYFISLVALLLTVVPARGAWSLDGRRDPYSRQEYVPAWVLNLLRFQLGVVYFFAGVAKLQADWLVHGEPLHTWLLTHTDWPVVGGLFSSRALAVAMSIAGAAFDLAIAPLLWWRRTRAAAYALVVGFHVATGALLNIGLFPWIMIGLTPIFFEPDWPRALLARLGRPQPVPARAPEASGAPGWGYGVFVAVWVLVQLALPLRHWAIPGDVRWTEEGWRFSWRVMLVEKRGWFRFRVEDPATGAQWVVRPDQQLTARQLQQASTNPQAIAQIAASVAEDFAQRGHPGVRVYADAWCSMNGRPAQRLIDPGVDLAGAGIDWWGADPWILPLESGS